LVKSARSTKQLNSKYKVQFYTEQTLQWVLPVLKRVEAGDYPARIALNLDCSRQHVQYYVRKLTDAGLVYLEKRSNIAVSVDGQR
jgi:predicted transcriptional regulator